MSYRLVKIEWIDACGDDGWKPIASAKKMTLTKVTSAGFVLRETKELLVLGHNVSDKHVNGTMVIPKAWVVKVESL